MVETRQRLDKQDFWGTRLGWAGPGPHLQVFVPGWVMLLLQLIEVDDNLVPQGDELPVSHTPAVLAAAGFAVQWPGSLHESHSG